MFKLVKKIQELRHPAADGQPERQTAGNALDFRAELLGKIVKNRFFKRYSMDETITQPFVLWVTAEGQNYQTEVRKPDFIKSLRKAFDDADLPEAGSRAQWVVNTAPLPENADFYKIDEGIYLDTRPVDEQPDEQPGDIPAKARIVIAENSGSLIRHEYLLDAEKQQSWQIGKGEKDRTGRKNHIAISDSDTDPQYDSNKYVSNAHAQIVFVKNKGFCVKSLNDSYRTIVYRNENRVIDQRDIHSKSIPLQDGDHIELGKSVVLKFKIISFFPVNN